MTPPDGRPRPQSDTAPAAKIQSAKGRVGGQSRLRARAAGFWQRQDGASTIEFVVLFPVLVLLVLFIAWASGVISRASNVQEIAHDLARSALRYHRAATPAELCQTLIAGELDNAIKRSGETLPKERFQIGCTAMRNTPVIGAHRVEITVGYDAAGDVIGDLGRSFGWNLTRIERRSAMIF